MRRSPRIAPPALWAAAAVMTLLSLMLALPASAVATSVSQCSSGDRSYSSVGATSATATAPEGYQISSFCVVGRGNAGAETHTLSAPQETVVVSHSTGKQLESYSVTYVRIPVASEPEPEDEPAGKTEPKAERTAEAEETKAQASRSATAEKSPVAGEDSDLGPLPNDGEELKITKFEDEDENVNRWSVLVVGGIILVGLIAGAIALTVRLPGQR